MLSEVVRFDDVVHNLSLHCELFGIEKLGFKHPSDFVTRPSFALECLNQNVDPILCVTKSFGSQLNFASWKDESSGTMAKLENALVLKFRIRLGDCVVTCDDLLG